MVIKILFNELKDEYNDNIKHQLKLKKGQLGFTFCQVPIVYTLVPKGFTIEICNNKSKSIFIKGEKINIKLSQSIFNRDCKIQQINVNIEKNYLFN